MNPQIESLRGELKRAEATVEVLKDRLQNIVVNCQHNWTKPVREFVVTSPAYRIPAEYRGGVLYRGEMFVQEKEEPQWTRTCTNCGKVECTTQQKTKETYEPIW